MRKRITAITRSGSFVDWHGVPALASDLNAQRQAISKKVAEADPKEALDLLWRFMALAGSMVAVEHRLGAQVIQLSKLYRLISGIPRDTRNGLVSNRSRITQGAVHAVARA